MNGVVNVFKTAGYTSHDVVAIVRRMLPRGVKVGHTGTLDPQAQGVLPILIGRATKFSDAFMGGDKTYIAEVVPGIETATGDIHGEILRESSRRDYLSLDLKEILAQFVGEIAQIPPMYSAVKVGGRKLYELARDGKVVKRKPRTVTIYGIELLEMRDGGRFFIRVDCSKGTYIRTLCEDIGRTLGCGAAMGELARTRSGGFLAENAIKLDALQRDGVAAHMQPLYDALCGAGIKTDCVLTIGKFECVHKGHAFLLRQTVQIAREQGLYAAVLVIDTGVAPYGTVQRENAFNAMGLDFTVNKPLDDSFKQMQARDFCAYLFDILCVQNVVVGDDFRFGYERTGDVTMLINEAEKYGRKVTVVKKLPDVSTTEIKRLLASGETTKAEGLLCTI